MPEAECCSCSALKAAGFADSLHLTLQERSVVHFRFKTGSARCCCSNICHLHPFLHQSSEMTHQQFIEEFKGVQFRLTFVSNQEYCHEATVSVSPRPLLLKTVRTVATPSPYDAHIICA